MDTRGKDQIYNIEKIGGLNVLQKSIGIKIAYESN